MSRFFRPNSGERDPSNSGFYYPASKITAQKNKILSGLEGLSSKYSEKLGLCFAVDLSALKEKQ